MKRLVSVALPLLVTLVVGCTGTASQPSGEAVTTIAASRSPAASETATVAGISVQNGSTLTVTVAVNDAVVETMGPGTCLGCGGGVGIPAADLPPQPWHVALRAPSGRTLTTLTVRAGDVRSTSGSGGTSVRGVGSRLDLSCGRIDVWAGPPIDGPAPGTGSPGDCLP